MHVSLAVWISKLQTRYDNNITANVIFYMGVFDLMMKKLLYKLKVKVGTINIPFVCLPGHYLNENT